MKKFLVFALLFSILFGAFPGMVSVDAFAAKEKTEKVKKEKSSKKKLKKGEEKDAEADEETPERKRSKKEENEYEEMEEVSEKNLDKHQAKHADEVQKRRAEMQKIRIIRENMYKNHKPKMHVEHEQNSFPYVIEYSPAIDSRTGKPYISVPEKMLNALSPDDRKYVSAFLIFLNNSIHYRFGRPFPQVTSQEVFDGQSAGTFLLDFDNLKFYQPRGTKSFFQGDLKRLESEFPQAFAAAQDFRIAEKEEEYIGLNLDIWATTIRTLETPRDLQIYISDRLWAAWSTLGRLRKMREALRERDYSSDEQKKSPKGCAMLEIFSQLKKLEDEFYKITVKNTAFYFRTLETHQSPTDGDICSGGEGKIICFNQKEILKKFKWKEDIPGNFPPEYLATLLYPKEFEALFKKYAKKPWTLLDPEGRSRKAFMKNFEQNREKYKVPEGNHPLLYIEFFRSSKNAVPAKDVKKNVPASGNDEEAVPEKAAFVPFSQKEMNLVKEFESFLAGGNVKMTPQHIITLWSHTPQFQRFPRKAREKIQKEISSAENFDFSVLKTWTTNYYQANSKATGMVPDVKFFRGTICGYSWRFYESAGEYYFTIGYKNQREIVNFPYAIQRSPAIDSRTGKPYISVPAKVLSDLSDDDRAYVSAFLFALNDTIHWYFGRPFEQLDEENFPDGSEYWKSPHDIDVWGSKKYSEAALKAMEKSFPKIREATDDLTIVLENFDSPIWVPDWTKSMIGDRVLSPDSDISSMQMLRQRRTWFRVFEAWKLLEKLKAMREMLIKLNFSSDEEKNSPRGRAMFAIFEACEKLEPELKKLIIGNTRFYERQPSDPDHPRDGKIYALWQSRPGKSSYGLLYFDREEVTENVKSCPSFTELYRMSLQQYPRDVFNYLFYKYADNPWTIIDPEGRSREKFMRDFEAFRAKKPANSSEYFDL